MQSNHSNAKAHARRVPRAVRLALIPLISLVGAGFGAAACLDRPICPDPGIKPLSSACRPQTTNLFVDTITQNSVDKIDLLFMIDNSASMADKQAVLKEAVPDLVTRLVTPICVDAEGHRSGTQVQGTGNCNGTDVREFTAIKNIHIGVITSSLGDHGAQQKNCGGNDSGDLKAEENDDHAHLIATRPRWAKEPVIAPSQPPESAGFLNWSPGSNGQPVGQDVNAFNNTFKMMVTASSEFGCGFEAQLESIYRFLIDPKPPLSITKQNCPGSTQPCAYPTGKDDALIAERVAFLRPDSLVAIIMVTDENDCSIRDTQQFFYAARDDIALPHGTAICAQNPNDKCCYSCAQTTPPAGCQADPTCTPSASTADEDKLNLRCFNDKQRFGLDFLYPTQRYVNAFHAQQLCTSNVDLGYDLNNQASCPDADKTGGPDIVPNPLYSDGSALPRPSSLVFVAGIIGVPWQDIQAKTDKDGNAYPMGELHYKTAVDLKQPGGWEVILGDSSRSPPLMPTDGLMVESRFPRNGNDVNGKLIPGPLATQAEDNTINHHDWSNNGKEDLMYACIFPLLGQPRDCVAAEKLIPLPGCDCASTNKPGDNNPLCQNPANGQYGTLQYAAKAYPGLRELQVLKDFGDNSIVASLCARNLTDGTAQDYGYRPAVDAIIDRLKEALTGRCLPRKLVKDRTGKIPCSILEVVPRASAPNGCNVPGRTDPHAAGHDKVIAPALARLKEKGICDAGGQTPSCGQYLICELNALPDDSPCHQDVAVQPAPGWCYVDPATQPADDKKLVAKCPASQQRIIRFVSSDPNTATPAKGAQVLIACFGAAIDEEGAPAATVTMMPPPGAGGTPPVAGDGGP